MRRRRAPTAPAVGSDPADRAHPLACRACRQPIGSGERAWFVDAAVATGLHRPCDRALLVGTR